MKADSRYTHQHITHQSRAHSRPHTPHSLCLDPHTTLANTYNDFRVTTYNLRLTTYTHQPNSNWDSVCWGDVRSPPPVSLSSQPIVTTYDLRLMTSQLCFTGTHHHQQPTTTSSLSLTQFNCSLRLVTTRLTFNRSLRLTTYDLRLTTYDIPALLYWDPLTTSSFSVQYLSQEPASQPTLATLSEYPLRKQTSQHTNTNHHQQSLSSISLSEYPLRKQTSQHQPLKR